MKSAQAFRFKIFAPLFLLLVAVSAVSSATATAAVSSGRSAVPTTMVAILISLAICGLAAQVVSRALAIESGRLASAIGDLSDPPRGKRNTAQSPLFAEVAAAWHKAALKWERAVHHENQKVNSAGADMLELVSTLSKALEERSPFLRGHSERVAEYSVAIAQELGMDKEEIERVRIAALVHDIGMISVGDASLKKNRLLAVREFEILRAHPARGAAILRSIESLHDLIPAVELHHEALDGTGYPYGLTDKEIPLMARILAVADTFDSMICVDPSQPALTPADAVDALESMVGTRLDGRVVNALIRFLDRDHSMPNESFLTQPIPDIGEREIVEAHYTSQIR
jgi:HD-GYP domain-containing protein (c-di-GMP phosphodiesterase class II)